jgi:hypothetical protein
MMSSLRSAGPSLRIGQPRDELGAQGGWFDDGVHDELAGQVQQVDVGALVLDFLRYPAEVTVCNVEVRSLDPGYRLAIVAKRDRYGARVRRIIEQGCRTGRFRTPTPQIAAFAVLEMGNSAKSWFRPGGRYTDTYVARAYGEFALRVVGHAD